MKKNIFLIVVFLIYIIVFSGILYADSGQDLSTEFRLGKLIASALANNPDLEAAAARAEAAEKAVAPAGALPDPKLTLGLMNLPINSFSFRQEPMTGKLISIMQTFPFPGKLGLASDIAEREAKAVEFLSQESRVRIILLVKQIYFELYSVDRALETIRKNQILLEQFVQAAEIRYATGSGLQQDVLRAQLEQSKLADDLLMWTQKRQAVSARLNALLNRPVSLQIPVTPSDLKVPESSSRLLPAEIDSLRPLLLAGKAKIEKAEKAVDLARRSYWPDFSVGASYSQRDNSAAEMVRYDFFSIQITIDIPLFKARKQRARLQEADLRLSASKAEFKSAYNDILAQIETIQSELERNRKRAGLYKNGILIQAELALSSAFSGYQVGKVDFLTLLSSWMTLQNYELQYYFSLADYYKAEAAYEAAAGLSSDFIITDRSAVSGSE